MRSHLTLSLCRALALLLGKDQSSDVPGPRHAARETAVGRVPAVRRLAWSQLRFRAGRALALLAGILVAATAFTVLTAAARTAQIRTIGTVSAHFRPAYDILVRPAGARSKLESATGTVQPDFLSGIYGGITMAQYHQIRQISGVSVAAPIAMVGYGFMNAIFPVWLPAADVSRPGRQLYRVNTTWVSAGGASRIRQPPWYVYVTPNRVQYRNRTQATSELLPGGSAAVPCPAAGQPSTPFSYHALAGVSCFSKVNGEGVPPGTFFFPNFHGRPGFAVDWQFPMLLAAVNPAAEAKLDGLSHALAFGHYLPETYRNAVARPLLPGRRQLPGAGRDGQRDRRVRAEPGPGTGHPGGAAGAEHGGHAPGRHAARPPGAEHHDHRPAGLQLPARQPGAGQRPRHGRHRVLDVLVSRPGAVPAGQRRRPGPGNGAQPGLGVGDRAQQLVLPAAGQRRHPVPDVAAARHHRPEHHLADASAGRHVRPAQDRGVRPAVPGAAGAIPADRGPRPPTRPAGRPWAAGTCCPA